MKNASTAALLVKTDAINHCRTIFSLFIITFPKFWFLFLNKNPSKLISKRYVSQHIILTASSYPVLITVYTVLELTSLDLSICSASSLGASPHLHPVQIFLRFSPTHRRGAVGRPTSAAGSAPEESNVTSGGTRSPVVLCSQDLNTHIHTHRVKIIWTQMYVAQIHQDKHLSKAQTDAQIYIEHMCMNSLRCHPDMNMDTHTKTVHTWPAEHADI